MEPTSKNRATPEELQPLYAKFKTAMGFALFDSGIVPDEIIDFFIGYLHSDGRRATLVTRDRADFYFAQVVRKIKENIDGQKELQEANPRYQPSFDLEYLANTARWCFQTTARGRISEFDLVGGNHSYSRVSNIDTHCDDYSEEERK